MDKISKNASYCLETLTVDVENLENKEDFVQLPKRKRKLAEDPTKTPVKKRKMSKKRLLEAARQAEVEEPTAKIGKMFISDEAEGIFF